MRVQRGRRAERRDRGPLPGRGRPVPRALLGTAQGARPFDPRGAPRARGPGGGPAGGRLAPRPRVQGAASPGGGGAPGAGARMDDRPPRPGHPGSETPVPSSNRNVSPIFPGLAEGGTRQSTRMSGNAPCRIALRQSGLRCWSGCAPAPAATSGSHLRRPRSRPPLFPSPILLGQELAPSAGTRCHGRRAEGERVHAGSEPGYAGHGRAERGGRRCELGRSFRRPRSGPTRP